MQIYSELTQSQPCGFVLSHLKFSVAVNDELECTGQDMYCSY